MFQVQTETLSSTAKIFGLKQLGINFVLRHDPLVQRRYFTPTSSTTCLRVSTLDMQYLKIYRSVYHKVSQTGLGYKIIHFLVF